MKSSTRTIIVCVGVIATFIAGAAVGAHCSLKWREPRVLKETDTLTITKVITQTKPNALESVQLGYDIPVVPDLLFLTDSIAVHDTLWLPRERKVYQDSNYRAVVSGFQPSLDSISIFQHERVITQVVQIPSPPRRWGVGISAGYGVGVSGGRIVTAPYIGLGVTYNLCFFGKKR